ncbi:MAG: hypothetical protein NTX03_13515 [Bacteroidetes bacterium]|nr:hypothetical protein [Bacteroidota bacterium]
MDKEIEIENWKADYQRYLEELNEQLKAEGNEEARALYYGFYVIDGIEINLNPDVLFIGINPGKGGGEKQEKVKMFTGYKMSYLDYWYDKTYNYTSAIQTIEVLGKANFNEIEIKDLFNNHTVKTNLYSIITNNARGIKECLNLLTPQRFDEFHKKSCAFSVALINILKPKVVIFEGKSIWNCVIGDCFEQESGWNHQLNIGEFNSENPNILFLGYARRFSYIISNKEVLAEKIKTVLGNK